MCARRRRGTLMAARSTASVRHHIHARPVCARRCAEGHGKVWAVYVAPHASHAAELSAGAGEVWLCTAAAGSPLDMCGCKALHCECPHKGDWRYGVGGDVPPQQLHSGVSSRGPQRVEHGRRTTQCRPHPCGGDANTRHDASTDVVTHGACAVRAPTSHHIAAIIGGGSVVRATMPPAQHECGVRLCTPHMRHAPENKGGGVVLRSRPV